MKAPKTIFLLLVLLFIAPLTLAAIPEPTAWYQLNSNGTVIDSFNHKNGLMVGNPIIVTGIIGNAYELNPDEYINITNTMFNGDKGNFTWTFWIKSNQPQYLNFFVGGNYGYTDCNGQVNSICLDIQTDDYLYFDVLDNSYIGDPFFTKNRVNIDTQGGGWSLVNDSTPRFLNDDAWHQIIITVGEGSGINNSNSTIYFDGQQLYDPIYGSVSVGYNFSSGFGAENLMLFGNTFGDQDIIIDEVGFFNKSITSSQAQELWNNGLGVTYATPPSTFANFSDDMETGTATENGWTHITGATALSFGYSTDQAHEGTQSLLINSTGVSSDEVVGVHINTFRNKTLEFWFYDDNITSDSPLMGVASNDATNDGNIPYIAWSSGNEGVYSYSPTGSGTLATTISRSPGWHNAKMILNNDATNIIMYLDDTLISNNTDDYSFIDNASIGVYTFIGASNVYLDDVAVYETITEEPPSPLIESHGIYLAVLAMVFFVLLGVASQFVPREYLSTVVKVIVLLLVVGIVLSLLL